MKKILSLIALTVLCLSFNSCSDEENINTTDATVAFPNPTFSIKESKGFFNIPVVVAGAVNGPIYVTVDVEATDANCKEDVNYLITSKNIVIPASKKYAYIEIKAIDDRVINDDRKFRINITDVRGASKGSTLSSIDVTLTDNDDIPYERMSGVWTVEATNVFNESGPAPISWDMNLNIVEEEDDSYGSAITSTPWALFDGSIPVLSENGDQLSHPMTFHHNAVTGVTTVDLRMGTKMSPEVDLGIIEGVDANNNKISVDCTKATFRSATESFGGALSYTGTITGIVNEDFTEVKFSQPLYIILFATNGQPFQFQACFTDLTLKIKQ